MISPRISNKGNQEAGTIPVPVFCVVLAAILLAACGSVRAPETKTVLEAIESTDPLCRFEQESRVALGGLKMSAVKALVRMAGDTEGADVISNIRRVEVVTYRADPPGACAAPESLGPFAAEMADRGWQLMLIERSDSGSDWIYSRSEAADGEITGLYVVQIDRDELEIVRLEGQVDRIFAEALAEEPGGIADLLGSTN